MCVCTGVHVPWRMCGGLRSALGVHFVSFTLLKTEYYIDVACNGLAAP